MFIIRNRGHGIAVQIANIGSFTYNQVVPLESPRIELPPAPTPMKCRDADFIRLIHFNSNKT